MLGHFVWPWVYISATWFLCSLLGKCCLACAHGDREWMRDFVALGLLVFALGGFSMSLSTLHYTLSKVLSSWEGHYCGPSWLPHLAGLVVCVQWCHCIWGQCWASGNSTGASTCLSLLWIVWDSSWPSPCLGHNSLRFAQHAAFSFFVFQAVPPTCVDLLTSVIYRELPPPLPAILFLQVCSTTG